jgi:Protein of unknown function (DUF2939)
MRWFFGVIVALSIAVGIYVASALVSLSSLANAARAGNGAEVLARTDMPRLRRSLVDQIVTAYLRQLGHDRPVKPLERIAANTFGASVADAMIGKMLTEENLTNILNKGTISSGETGVTNMARLSEIDTSTIFEVLHRLSLVKPVEFLVRLGDTDSDGGVSVHFEGNGWKVLAQSLSDSKGRKG